MLPSATNYAWRDRRLLGVWEYRSSVRTTQTNDSDPTESTGVGLNDGVDEVGSADGHAAHLLGGNLRLGEDINDCRADARRYISSGWGFAGSAHPPPLISMQVLFWEGCRCRVKNGSIGIGATHIHTDSIKRHLDMGR